MVRKITIKGQDKRKFIEGITIDVKIQTSSDREGTERKVREVQNYLNDLLRVYFDQSNIQIKQ